MSLDGSAARLQHGLYIDMLSSNATLSERRHVLPFFSSHVDLCLLFSHYIPAIRKADRFATEFSIQRDFKADLIVGDFGNGKYLLVEFEDGSPTSIFLKGSKAYPDFAARFERAFSQIVDWLWKLDDMRSTSEFINVFGQRQIGFTGLIVTGKNMNLAQQELGRLRWREHKIRVDSKAISILSFDQFAEDADHWLRTFYQV